MAPEPEEEDRVYSIKELPPKAQKKVLERWRFKIWDDHDSQWLTETFKEILSQRGFSNPDVGWGLNYTQGDGVCFSGSFDLEKFFSWIFSGEKAAKPYRKEARKFTLFQDLLSVKITGSRSYCHWNSMHVEIEVTGSAMDLVPEKLRKDARNWYEEEEWIREKWLEEKRAIDYQRNRPIYEWEKRIKELQDLRGRGPKEWRPNVVRPKPEPLDIPYPPEPPAEAPPVIQRAIDKAVAIFSGIDPLIAEFDTFLGDWIKDTSRELEKIGYAEIEYRQSDEAIIEFLDNNNYEFFEDGEEI